MKSLITNKNRPYLINDITEGLGMGLSLISVLFASSLLGYFFGKTILEKSHFTSLILAILIGYSCLLIETGLIIIKS